MADFKEFKADSARLVDGMKKLYETAPQVLSDNDASIARHAIHCGLAEFLGLEALIIAIERTAEKSKDI